MDTLTRQRWFDRVAIASVIGGSICVLVASGIVSPSLSAQSAHQWKVLFDGKDLSEWTQTGAAQWTIENGVLVGGQGQPGQRGSSLVSKTQYKDFELELDFLLAEHGTQCSAELIGPEQANASAEKTCLYNSGVSVRTGYQINIGRREAGEFIGVVVHRVTPAAIRKNVLWLDKGDEKYPNLRKKADWNHLQIRFKGPRLQVTLNGKAISDVTDNPTDPAETKWKEAGPISLQWPPSGESGGFSGFVKYRNIRIRER